MPLASACASRLAGGAVFVEACQVHVGPCAVEVRRAEVVAPALAELLAQDDVGVFDPLVVVAPRVGSGRIVAAQVGVGRPVVEVVVSGGVDGEIGAVGVPNHAQGGVAEVELDAAAVGLAHADVSGHGVDQSVEACREVVELVFGHGVVAGEDFVDASGQWCGQHRCQYCAFCYNRFHFSVSGLIVMV